MQSSYLCRLADYDDEIEISKSWLAVGEKIENLILGAAIVRNVGRVDEGTISAQGVDHAAGSAGRLPNGGPPEIEWTG